MGLEDRVNDGSIVTELFEYTPTGIQIVDCNGRILMANPAVAELSGRSIGDLIDRSTYSLLSDEDAERFMKKCEIVKERGKGRGIYGIVDSDGNVNPVLRRCVASYDTETGLFEGGFIFDTDYSQSSRIIEKLFSERKKHKTLISNAPIGIFQTKPDGSIIDINSSAAMIWGYESTKDMQKKVPDITSLYVDPKDRQTVIERAGVNGYIADREVLFKKPDGGRVWIELNLRIQYTKNGAVSHYEGFITDITERKKSTLELIQKAHYDPITHLPNRNLFDDRLNQIISYVTRENTGEAAVLVADLNKFKEVNDTYGHHIGDRILKEAGKRMAKSVREYDTVARIGGDEFGIVLQNTSRELAHRRIEGLKETVCKPYIISSIPEPINISVSLGVAVCPHDGNIPSELLRIADRNMYSDKKQ